MQGYDEIKREQFLAQFQPMQRAKIAAALDRQMKFDGRPNFRGSEVERRVASGCRVVVVHDERRLIDPVSQTFLGEKQISKTAMDYAAFLLA